MKKLYKFPTPFKTKEDREQHQTGEMFNILNTYFMVIGMKGNYHEAQESLETTGVLEEAKIPQDVESLKTKAKYSIKGKNKT